MKQLEKLIVSNDAQFLKPDDLFYKGMRVVSTEEAMHFGVVRSKCAGTVAGIGRKWVYVKRDGKKTSIAYATSFWIPAPRQKKRRPCTRCQGTGYIWMQRNGLARFVFLALLQM